MQLVVPPLEREPWPTLGPGVVAAIEDNLVFGPGDLRGTRVTLDAEQKALIYRAYEVYPKGTPREGKRRFQRVGISLRKGLRKTELAAFIAAVELHPESPVRCDGFRRTGRTWVPVGRPVRDPYIPMLAYTEDQTEELGYGALYAILTDSNCAWVDDFDCALERIMPIDAPGKAEALANAPSAADGARTTFQHKDETGRWVLATHRETAKATSANLLKRPIADPWELETTTMYEPGQGSVAEGTHDFARKIDAGEVKHPRLFFFHRQADPKWDLTDPAQRPPAVIEASGPAASWSDIDGICGQWEDPDADLAYLDRMWCNRPVRSGAKAFDVAAWARNARPQHRVARHALITLGFDGSKYWDATALIGTEILTGYQWVVGIWARPENWPADRAWEVDENDVDVAVDGAFHHFTVWRLYGDPAKWETRIAAWAGQYGDKVVLKWPMIRRRQTAQDYRAYASAIVAGDVTNSGNKLFAAHIGNAHKRFMPERDDDGAPLWVAQKERPDSEHKIDAAAAGNLSWKARLEAIAAGVGNPVDEPIPAIW